MNENYVFILNTCHDTAKRAETRYGFPVIFLNFHRFVILYISCDSRSVGLWTILYTKVSNGFNRETLCAENSRHKTVQIKYNNRVVHMNHQFIHLSKMAGASSIPRKFSCSFFLKKRQTKKYHGEKTRKFIEN